MKWLLPLVLAIGCAHAPSKVSDLDKAVNIVWRDVYKVHDYSPPVIEFVRGDALVCGANNTRFFTELDGKNVCVSGALTWQTYTAQVAFWKGARLSDTALAHELCHAYSRVILKVSDPNHQGPCFTSDGLVKQANNVLWENGL